MSWTKHPITLRDVWNLDALSARDASDKPYWFALRYDSRSPYAIFCAHAPSMVDANARVEALFDFFRSPSSAVGEFSASPAARALASFELVQLKEEGLIQS